MVRPVIEITSERQLFVDRELIDRMEHATLKLHEPMPGGVAIRIDKPWEGPVNFGASVIQHQGHYLLYYRVVGGKDDRSALCVATSDDGVTWHKPSLGQVRWKDGSDTNILASDPQGGDFEYNSAPWVDTRPGVPASEIVKATTSEPLSGERHTAYADPGGPKRLVFWGSPDGLAFHKLNPQPDLVSHLPNCFDGGNTLFWSEAEDRYVIYYRCWGPGGRSMARTTSPDLMQWADPVVMTYGDAPAEQFYVNNTMPYFRASRYYIAPAARFMEKRRVLTDEQAQAIGLQMSHGHFYGNDCSDGVLLTTRAGSAHYDRTFMETFIRPGLGYPNWVSRTNYPLTGILPFGYDRMMLFVSRHYMQTSWHIERMVLRTDGFVSVSAPWSGGELVTRPLTFKGNRLDLNYRTGTAGSVRVELQDAAGRAVPGYALEDCPEIIGDEISRIVAWKTGPTVEPWAGQSVRLRFVLRDADVFSFQFLDA